MKINEIASIRKADYLGGQAFLNYVNNNMENSRPLYAGSKIQYIMRPGHFHKAAIYLIDTANSNIIVGKLILGKTYFPTKEHKSWAQHDQAGTVEAVTVHEDYRNQGLAKAMYRIALLPPPYGAGAIVVSGSEQTPDGRMMWATLHDMDDIAVQGYLSINKKGLTADPIAYSSFHDPEIKIMVEKLSDAIANLNGQYMGEKHDQYVFVFPVTVHNREIAALGRDIKIYKEFEEPFTYVGLVARYIGSAA